MSNILLIESDCHYAAFVDTVARKMFHTTFHAPPDINWQDLLCEHKIELLFVDLPLPHGESGWKAISALKNSRFRNIPIVAMSVIMEVADYDRALQLGCNEYLSKPYSAYVIAEAIQHYIGGEFNLES